VPDYPRLTVLLFALTTALFSASLRARGLGVGWVTLTWFVALVLTRRWYERFGGRGAYPWRMMLAFTAVGAFAYAGIAALLLYGLGIEWPP
jgi:hypothetical protein